MMCNFPFYPHFPSKSYRSYPHKFNKSPIRKPNYTSEHSAKANALKENNHKNAENTDDEKFFEILGIKLYSDDILLLCLIFFLYKEGVQDEYLFIALIMLLLS